MYGSNEYSTLGDVPINGNSTTCQSESKSIPIGWEIADDSDSTRTLIRSYGWSTSYVAVRNSSNAYYGIGTRNALNQSHNGDISCDINDGMQCSVKYCNAQILIRRIRLGN